MTTAEREAQLGSFLDLARSCYNSAVVQLASLGLKWGERDLYKLAKFYHGAPAVAKTYLPVIKPGNFQEFKTRLSVLDPDGSVSRALDNADRCGSVVGG